jgi:hypothetical protein
MGQPEHQTVLGIIGEPGHNARIAVVVAAEVDADRLIGAVGLSVFSVAARSR